MYGLIVYIRYETLSFIDVLHMHNCTYCTHRSCFVDVAAYLIYRPPYLFFHIRLFKNQKPCYSSGPLRPLWCEISANKDKKKVSMAHTGRR